MKNKSVSNRHSWLWGLAWLLATAPAWTQTTPVPPVPYAENLISGLTVSGNPASGHLNVSFSVAKKDQVASIVILLDAPLSIGNTQAGALPNYIVCYPYYYLGDVFWAYQDKRIPYQSNPLSLDITLSEAQKSLTGLRVYTTDPKGKASEPIAYTLPVR